LLYNFFFFFFCREEGKQQFGDEIYIHLRYWGDLYREKNLTTFFPPQDIQFTNPLIHMKVK